MKVGGEQGLKRVQRAIVRKTCAMMSPNCTILSTYPRIVPHKSEETTAVRLSMAVPSIFEPCHCKCCSFIDDRSCDCWGFTLSCFVLPAHRDHDKSCLCKRYRASLTEFVLPFRCNRLLGSAVTRKNICATSQMSSWPPESTSLPGITTVPFKTSLEGLTWKSWTVIIPRAHSM